MNTEDNVIGFPLNRRGLAGPAGLPAEMAIKRLTTIAHMLECLARETPYPMWIMSLSNETRRVARQMEGHMPSDL